MSSLNTLVLAKFAKHIRFGTDIKSAIRRNQCLAIIYLNLSIPIMLIMLSSILSLALSITDTCLLVFIYLPLDIISMYFLRKSKPEMAASIVLVNLHVICYFGHVICNLPLACVCAQVLFPNFAFVLKVPKTAQKLNHILSTLQFAIHMRKIIEVFEVTILEEQLNQIYKYLFVAILMYLLLAITAYVSNNVEDDMWKCAQSDFDKLQCLTEEMVQAVAAKDTFISSLSHEIRNPLNSMCGSINYLLEVVKDQNHVKILSNAKMSGEILLNLLNNALDAAKLKSNKMEILRTEMSFEEVIRKVLVINTENLKKLGISVKAYIDSCLPKAISSDPNRLLQIMMNLMSNAIKFTNKGGKINIHVGWYHERENLLAKVEREDDDNDDEEGDKRERSRFGFEEKRKIPVFSRIINEPTMTSYDSEIFKECQTEESEKRILTFRSQYKQNFKLFREFKSSANIFEPWIIKHIEGEMRATNQRNGYLNVQISDTGCGISQENIKKLFGMFAQAHQGIAQRYGGTGLGLWICKQLCQKMGGDITVYSQLNRGTQFVFYIPIDYNDNRVTSPMLRIPDGAESHKVTALVVDDFAFNRDLHKLILEREGVQVVLASDGKEAVAKYQSKRDGYFDFIMMDIQMPAMNGFTAAKIIRRWEIENKRKKADIYFVSGEYYNEEGLLEEFRTTGGGNSEDLLGIRCLKKPVDVQMIKKIIEKYRVY